MVTMSYVWVRRLLNRMCGKPLRDVRLMLCDVDGTLTDGGMYYTAQGDFMKLFYARDGMGLQLVQQAGIKTGIITSETTEIVASRARKLGLDFLYQGRRGHGKVEAAQEICAQMGITMAQVLYVGDDVNDIEMLQAVGHPCCPNDAAKEVLRLKGIYITHANGGRGCVREIADALLSHR